MMEIMSAIGTFFGVLLIMLFAIAVTSQGALKGPDAFVLRWTVLSLAVAFSALVAWLRWRVLQRRKLSSTAAAVTGPKLNEQIKTAHQSSSLGKQLNGLSVRNSTEDLVAHALMSTISSLSQPSGPPATRVSADIMAAGKQAILFRQHFPPQHGGSTLSFFGGAPIAPRGLRWPRADGSGAPSKPFSFLMQIDCAAVPAPARLRMLPASGVLYFFLDLTWGEPNPFRVLYTEGGNDCSAIPPEDLGPAFGDQATYVWRWTQSAEDCPRLLPKWTFQPVAIEIPTEAYAPDEREDDDAPLWWPGEKVMAEALRSAQGEEVLSSPFRVQDFIDADGIMRRPFANYPHDWRAVQICSGLLLDRLRETYRVPGAAALGELSDVDRNALVMRIKDEARSWFDRATSHAPFSAVPQAESDRFWSWLADYPWLVRFVISDALTLSIEASLTDSQEAAARIPADVARRVHARHALAARSERGLFVTTPDRMLAPPVDVQGHQSERAKTHLLLLELSSNDGLGHHFGEGVYQFWITPDDLKARRFEKVELTADAY
jgi:uncharacterized protein YwqG